MPSINVDIEVDELIDACSEGELKRFLKKCKPANLAQLCRDAGLTVIGAAAPDDGARNDLWRELQDDIRRAARGGDWRHLEVLFLRMNELAGVQERIKGTYKGLLVASPSGTGITRAEAEAAAVNAVGTA